jgi:hypothetical protein
MGSSAKSQDTARPLPSPLPPLHTWTIPRALRQFPGPKTGPDRRVYSGSLKVLTLNAQWFHPSPPGRLGRESQKKTWGEITLGSIRAAGGGQLYSRILLPANFATARSSYCRVPSSFHSPPFPPHGLPPDFLQSRHVVSFFVESRPSSNHFHLSYGVGRPARKSKLRSHTSSLFHESNPSSIYELPSGHPPS